MHVEGHFVVKVLDVGSVNAVAQATRKPMLVGFLSTLAFQLVELDISLLQVEEEGVLTV